MTIDPRSAGADDLLQALTVGDVAADDPAVVARFAQDAGLRRRWHAIAGTLADLRALRADLADPGPGAASALDAAAAIRAFRRDASRRWWLVVGAAAAALLLVGAIVWLNLSARGPVFDPMLGTGGEPAVLTPNGAWSDGAPLQWPAVRGAAGYRVHVEAQPDGALVVWPNGPRGEPLPGNSWLPTPAQRAALPKHFRWCVDAVDASNQTIDTSPWATVRP